MMWRGRELTENSWLWHVGFSKVVATTEKQNPAYPNSFKHHCIPLAEHRRID